MFQDSIVRTFDINGEKRTDQTYRTEIIEHLTGGIAGKTFVDLGCADGFEAYCVGIRGAKYALGIDGRDKYLDQGRLAVEHFKLGERVDFQNKDVRIIDEYDLPKFDVVLHFGLLYHLQNPFNHLKRVRNIAGDELLMETQVAPLTLEGVERSQTQHMSDLTTVYLDGEPFEGRALEYVTRTGTTGIGSLDRRLVLWLTVESIQKALDMAGFDVLMTVHNDPPDELEPWSSLLGHNHKRAKALFHAKVREPNKNIVVEAGSVKGLFSAPYSYPQMSGFRKIRRKVLHHAMWTWREWFN